MSCYYLIASLPRLILGESPSWSPDEFKSCCHAQLDTRDAVAAERLCDGPDYRQGDENDEHPFIASWNARETQLRNAVARARAARRRGDAAGSIRPHTGFDVSIEEAVENAFDLPSPLDREKALDHLRWRILEELAGTAPFAPSVALAYAVKLRLAHRWAGMDSDAARERVGSALETEPQKNNQNSTNS